MKTKVFLLCTAALLISISGSAQKTDLSRIPARTVTLVSHPIGETDEKSVFNFEYGVKGYVRSSRQPTVNDSPNPRTSADLPNFGGDAQFPSRSSNRPFAERPNPQVYIKYGGLSFNGDANWLQVLAPLPAAQAAIKDMGEMKWSDVDLVPILEFRPHPHGFPVPGSRGRTIYSNEVIKPIAGHMYALHVIDQKKDYYALFRVEAVDPRGECTFSWKRVPSTKK